MTAMPWPANAVRDAAHTYMSASREIPTIAVARRSQPTLWMRSLMLVVLVAGCVEEGAHLTLSAPAGPGSAASFEVVLASPDATTIDNQRVGPKMLATESVVYYRQRTVAGIEPLTIDVVDGFTVKIEPSSVVMDSSFVPFALLSRRSSR